jgi:outer membrane lipoprotein-sorting protein
MRKKILFTLILCCVFVFEVKADYVASYEKLNKGNQIIVNKVNEYFDSLNTFRSNFIQFNESDSSMSEGLIYVEKPDKIRFEYTNPFRTLFIKNKGIINYYDADMDELIVVPQSISPIFGLFSKQDNLKKLNSEILSVKKVENGVAVETELSIEDNKISITYIFDGEITTLVGLNIDNGEKVELSFFNAELNPKLLKEIFVFDNPRLFHNKKRNQ